MNELWRPSTADLADVDIVRRAEEVAQRAARNAEALDHDGAFPIDGLGQLGLSGLLLAPFPHEMGGIGLGVDRVNPLALHDVLVALGRGSLSLGRLYEGHVNAVKLVRLYGTQANLELIHDETRLGFPTGVWMAEEATPLVFEPTTRTLAGRKILASGAGFIRRPLVAARAGEASLMLLPFIDERARADSSGWTASGMRATATGTVDFTGITIDDIEIVGHPGDYMRSPYFRGGAWRVLAVQLGGLGRVVDLFRNQLAESPHAEAPLQLARLSDAVIAVETARLWVREACLTAEGNEEPDRIDAYVDLARNAFEGVALRAIGAAQKAIGLRAYLRPNPLERVIRDLETYLRQPVLDLSLLSAGKYCLRRDRDGLCRRGGGT